MLEALRLARFSLVLRAEEELWLPPYQGSTLRGGFGSAFRRVACSRAAQRGPLPDCHGCALGSVCPYAYVFETAPTPGSQVLRKYRDVPRPFVLEPPLQPRGEYKAGERLVLGLVLVGRGIDYLPYFVVAFRELGKQGIGRRGGRSHRGRFALEEVRAVEEAGAGEVGTAEAG
ncbi:MAG: hypothetical protein K6T75_07965, partial [Acetobacteraceae bacterium]|nr:hypothetical protein [Acetobacteraceae bacterium]